MDKDEKWEINRKIIDRKYKEFDILLVTHKSGGISTPTFFREVKELFGPDCDMEGWQY